MNTEETEWWWIDYLESELDPKLEQDLELLLDHSQKDRDSFENFRLLKQWVRESDPVEGWPLEARLQRMHGRIMDAIRKPEAFARDADRRPDSSGIEASL